MNVLVVVFIG